MSTPTTRDSDSTNSTGGTDPTHNTQQAGGATTGAAPAPTRQPSSPASRHPYLVLGAIVGTQLMILLDATVVNVALPGIGTHLGFSATGMSWVLNVYTLAFGGLLLLGSRIGDLIGRRTAMVWGVAAFTVASIAGGLANDATTLLVARGFQGRPPRWPRPAPLP